MVAAQNPDRYRSTAVQEISADLIPAVPDNRDTRHGGIYAGVN
jgi:hypothetical protein